MNERTNEQSNVISNLSIRQLLIIFMLPSLINMVNGVLRLPYQYWRVVGFLITVGISLALICSMKVSVNKPPKIRSIGFDFSLFAIVYFLIWLHEGLIWVLEAGKLNDTYNIVGYSEVSVISDQIKDAMTYAGMNAEFILTIAVTVAYWIWDAFYAKLIIDRTYHFGGGVAILVSSILVATMNGSSWMTLIINILICIFMARCYVENGRLSNYILMPLLAKGLAVFSNIYLDIEFIGDYVGLEWLVVNEIYGYLEKALLLYGSFGLIASFFVGMGINLKENKKVLCNVGLLLCIVYRIGYIIYYTIM